MMGKSFHKNAKIKTHVVNNLEKMVLNNTQGMDVAHM